MSGRAGSGSGAPTRRRVLAGLALGALGACLPGRPPAAAVPDGPMNVGWRWVPGQRLTYRVVLEQLRPPLQTRRVERWTYTVREVVDGIATLDGRLVGLGGSVRRGGEPEDAAAVEAMLSGDRERGGEVSLRIGTDGRLRPADGGGCSRIGAPSAACFGAQLPHRLLAFPLPARTVSPGERWRDPDLAALVAVLVPAELRTSAEAGVDLYHLRTSPTGRIELLLGHHGVVQTFAGPALRLTGSTTWDPVRGVLAERQLSARLVGDPGGADVGELVAHLTLVS